MSRFPTAAVAAVAATAAVAADAAVAATVEARKNFDRKFSQPIFFIKKIFRPKNVLAEKCFDRKIFGRICFRPKAFWSKKFSSENSANCLFWRSYGGLDVIGRCASKNDPRGFDFQVSTTFGKGVKEIVFIFHFDF